MTSIATICPRVHPRDARSLAFGTMLLSTVLVSTLGASTLSASTLPVSVAREVVFSDGSRDHGWSDDGRFLAFTAAGTVVIPNQTGPDNRENVFLFDRQLATVALISRTDVGPAAGGNFSSRLAAISGDGTAVAFASFASDLGSSLTHLFAQIYLWRADSGAQNLAAGDGRLPDPTVQHQTRAGAEEHAELGLDFDGSTLVFVSTGDFGFADPTPMGADIYRHDIASGVTSLVSRSAAQPNTTGNIGSPVEEPHSWAMSDAGDLIAFVSRATDLVVDDVNGVETDVFLFDASEDSLVSISRSVATGATGNRLSRYVSMSGDGRYVAFESRATDLVAGMIDGNGGLSSDVFLYDHNDGSVTLVSASSVDPLRSGNLASATPVVDKLGNFVTFTSRAQDLVPGFVDGNAAEEGDIFRYEIATGRISLASRSSDDPRRSADGGSSEPQFADQQIVFESLATDLVDGFIDGNGDAGGDVYGFDPTTGAIALLSFASVGNVGGNGDSRLESVSAAGAAIVFESDADDLVVLDGVRSRAGHYVTDTSGTAIERVVRNNLMTILGASTMADGDSRGVFISDDGRWVAYSSQASNLTPTEVETNDLLGQVYLYDRTTGINTLLTPRAGTTTTGADGSSRVHAMSRDGSLIVIASTATNLIDGFISQGSVSNLFLIDRTAATTSLVSRDASNPLLGGNRSSARSRLSADGRYVLFDSEATNLVNPFVDLNGFLLDDVFLFDRVTESTTLVSASVAGGGQGANGAAGLSAISTDGRFVLFASRADNLVEGLTFKSSFGGNVYRWDRESGTSRLVSHRIGRPLVTADRGSGEASMTADGQAVVFESSATDLVTGDNAIQSQIYRWRAGDGLVDRVSHAQGDPDAAPDGASTGPTVSADGTTVVFFSRGSDLLEGLVNPGNTNQVFLHDFDSGQTTLITHQAGSPLTGSSESLVSFNDFEFPMTDDGRVVVYGSRASDLVAGFSHPIGESFPNTYRFDRDTGTNELISQAFESSTVGGGGSFLNALSSDGSIVAWCSPEPHLVPRDRNGGFDVFLGGADFDADLRITKTDAVDPVAAGEIIEYRLIVDHLATDAATGILISDVLPPRMTFEHAVGEGWACVETGGEVGCLRTAPLLGGATAPPLTIAARTSAGGKVENTASVSAGTPDLDPDSNVDSETTTVLPLGLLFADGFESGDTSAWSTTIP